MQQESYIDSWNCVYTIFSTVYNNNENIVIAEIEVHFLSKTDKSDNLPHSLQQWPYVGIIGVTHVDAISVSHVTWLQTSLLYK